MQRTQRGQPRRVLLVDDNKDVARSLARLLRSLGHDIHVAFSGEDALEAAERVQPQIIFMDIGLPGLTGYDTVREIRSKPWGKGVMLVALTGLGRPADRHRALEAGFNEYLTKPVPLEALQAVLDASAATRTTASEREHAEPEGNR